MPAWKILSFVGYFSPDNVLLTARISLLDFYLNKCNARGWIESKSATRCRHWFLGWLSMSGIYRPGFGKLFRHSLDLIKWRGSTTPVIIVATDLRLFDSWTILCGWLVVVVKKVVIQSPRSHSVGEFDKTKIIKCGCYRHFVYGKIWGISQYIRL